MAVWVFGISGVKRQSASIGEKGEKEESASNVREKCVVQRQDDNRIQGGEYALGTHLFFSVFLLFGVSSDFRVHSGLKIRSSLRYKTFSLIQ